MEVAGLLQTAARFPRTLLCPVAACPFTGHVLFTSLEALSLKRGQEPSGWSEAAEGSGLCGGQGLGGLYGLRVWGFFAHGFNALFLSAPPFVEFASSPREKCQVSPGGLSALLRGAPAVVEQWAGMGSCCWRNPLKPLGCCCCGNTPLSGPGSGAAAERHLTNTLVVISEGLAYGSSEAFP